MDNSVLRDVLSILAAAIVLLTIVGGVMMLRFSFYGITASNSLVKQLIRHLSVSNLLVGIIAMPFNLQVMLCKGASSCNIACLARYCFTFIFSSESLIILTVLCHYKRDLVIKAPFGKIPCVTEKNKFYIFMAAVLISVLPNIGLSSGYLYLMVTANSAPCKPEEEHKKTTHYYLGIVEGIKTGILFGVCFTLIIKDASKIRKKIAEQASRIGRASVTEGQTHTVNANIYFAIVFIAMWVPFSFIAVLAGSIPKIYYEDAYTVGYTLAYTSFALLPICYAQADKNFKAYVKSIFRLRKRRHSQHNSIFPTVDKDDDDDEHKADIA